MFSSSPAEFAKAARDEKEDDDNKHLKHQRQQLEKYQCYGMAAIFVVSIAVFLFLYFHPYDWFSHEHYHKVTSDHH